MTGDLSSGRLPTTVMSTISGCRLLAASEFGAGRRSCHQRQAAFRHRHMPLTNKPPVWRAIKRSQNACFLSPPTRADFRPIACYPSEWRRRLTRSLLLPEFRFRKRLLPCAEIWASQSRLRFDDARQPNDDCEPVKLARRLCPDATAVKPYDASGDREAEARPPNSGRGFLAARNDRTFVPFVFRNTRTIVFDRHAPKISREFTRQPDFAA